MLVELRDLVQDQVDLVVTVFRFLKYPFHHLEGLLEPDLVVPVYAFLGPWPAATLRLAVDHSLLPEGLLELKLAGKSVLASIVPFGLGGVAAVKVLSFDAFLDIVESVIVMVV